MSKLSAARGPGKYDAECVKALVDTGGHSVVLIVLDGVHGSGFSVASKDPLTERKLPELLRQLADVIEGVS